MLAARGGLPVARFVVATNANDEVPRYLETGVYETIVPSRECISNAMNVGHPSNLARLVDVYGGRMDEKGQVARQPDLAALRRDVYATSVDDDDTRATIGRVHREHGVVLEPHGAVGWTGLERFHTDHPDQVDTVAISLETAHPAKFPEAVREITGVDPELPPSLADLDSRTETFGTLENGYEAFKAHLREEYDA